MTHHAMTIMDGTSADAVAVMFEIIFPDAVTVLDVTYGRGKFWGKQRLELQVTGLDIDMARSPHVVGNFTKLDYPDNAFDVVVFDPPYQTDMGRFKPSVMGSRFGTFPTTAHLHRAVVAGCQEAWRVARLGVLVKVQDYIHGQRAVWMSRWAHDTMPVEPYDVIYLRQASKMIDPKWTRQLSIWRNHATFWAWRKDGDRHIPRE